MAACAAYAEEQLKHSNRWFDFELNAGVRFTQMFNLDTKYTELRKLQVEPRINAALSFCDGWPVVRRRLETLRDLGLGYLTLEEETPGLSGGEAQRLKLASEMGKTQSDAVFIFDEPTIGLHPLDVRTLLGVFQTLIDSGATVIVIEHDLDVIRNADYIIDMGPGGGEEGGRIVATGTPQQIKSAPAIITGRFI